MTDEKIIPVTLEDRVTFKRSGHFKTMYDRVFNEQETFKPLPEDDLLTVLRKNTAAWYNIKKYAQDIDDESGFVRQKNCMLDTGNGSYDTFPPIEKSIKEMDWTNRKGYGNYRGHPETVKSTLEFCKAEKIINPYDSASFTNENVIFGNGSTHLYALAVNRLIKKKGDGIIVPIPNYGMFLPQILKAGGTIIPVPLTEENGFRLTPEMVQKAVDKFNKEQGDLPEEEKPKVQGLLFANPHNPTGVVYTQKEIDSFENVVCRNDLVVIDDQAHRGVIMENRQTGIKPEMGSFQHNSILKNSSIALISISKAFCAADYRGGAAIGPKHLIEPISLDILDTIANVSEITQVAMQSCYSNNNIVPRKKYMAQASNGYALQRDIMKALIDGIDTIEDEALKNRIFNKVSRSFQKERENRPALSPKEADKLSHKLLKGIPGIRTMTSPEGCFFHLVDLSGLIGNYINQVKLERTFDFEAALKYFANARSIPGEEMGMLPDRFNADLPPLTRFSYSIYTDAVCDSLATLHFMVEKLVRKEPYKTPEELECATPIDGVERLDQAPTTLVAVPESAKTIATVKKVVAEQGLH